MGELGEVFSCGQRKGSPLLCVVRNTWFLLGDNGCVPVVTVRNPTAAGAGDVICLDDSDEEQQPPPAKKPALGETRPGDLKGTRTACKSTHCWLSKIKRDIPVVVQPAGGGHGICSLVRRGIGVQQLNSSHDMPVDLNS